MSAKRTLMSWSSGKDSAWALHVLQQDPSYEIVGLFCTVNQQFQRVAMHAVRLELLQQQAQCVGLPLHILNIPYPCSNADYENIMSVFIAQCKQDHIECMAFGDLFLQDIRTYRERNLAGTGITPLFPLWQIPTPELAQAMIQSGLRARLTCVDPKQCPAEFVGREFDQVLLDELPATVDPCGENGEFHSFVYAGPMFDGAVSIETGEVVEREGFVFADLRSVSLSIRESVVLNGGASDAG